MNLARKGFLLKFVVKNWREFFKNKLTLHRPSPKHYLLVWKPHTGEKKKKKKKCYFVVIRSIPFYAFLLYNETQYRNALCGLNKGAFISNTENWSKQRQSSGTSCTASPCSSCSSMISQKHIQHYATQPFAGYTNLQQCFNADELHARKHDIHAE